MAINIYRIPAEDSAPIESVAWLCDEVWLLPEQIDELSRWVQENSETLPPGEYVADIGFHARAGACGGGPILEAATMRRMGEAGISLYLSEYDITDSA